jgi:hypothetical protein
MKELKILIYLQKQGGYSIFFAYAKGLHLLNWGYSMSLPFFRKRLEPDATNEMELAAHNNKLLLLLK